MKEPDAEMLDKMYFGDEEAIAFARGCWNDKERLRRMARRAPRYA